MTGNELFERAIDLCGLNSGQDTTPLDVNDLKQRAVSLINQLLAENSVLDSRIKKSEHHVVTISRLQDAIECSEIISSAVLPYGLAMLFMIGEDDAMAANFRQNYESAKEAALKFGKPRIHGITGVYN